MTIQQMYKECERLYAEVDWNDEASIRCYNESVKELRKMREEEEERRREANKIGEVMVTVKLERIKTNYEGYRITLWEAAKEIADMVERGYINSEDADKRIRELARTKRRG